MKINGRPTSCSWRGSSVTAESFRSMPARSRASLIADPSIPITHVVELMSSLPGNLSHPAAEDFVDTFKCVGRSEPIVRLFYHSEENLVQRLPELIEGMQRPHWSAELFANPDMPVSAIIFAMDQINAHPNFPLVLPTVSHGTLSAIFDSPRLPIPRAADILARYCESSYGEHFGIKMTGMFRVLARMERAERLYGLSHDEYAKKGFLQAVEEGEKLYPEDALRLRNIIAS